MQGKLLVKDFVTRLVFQSFPLSHYLVLEDVQFRLWTPLLGLARITFVDSVNFPMH